MDKKFFFQVLGLIIVIFAGTALTFNPNLIPNLGSGSSVNTVNPADATTYMRLVDPSTGQVKAEIAVEIADTPEKRAQGLGGRPSLAANAGMLFIMEQRGKPVYWMKGMLLPLDFIWLDGDRVVDLLANVPPPEGGQRDETLPKYSPVVEVDKVLEVNAGFIANYQIKVGDIVQQFTPSSIQP